MRHPLGDQQFSYAAIECGECGIAFYVPTHWKESRQASSEAFYCPNGHCRAYKQSTVDKLRAELAERDRELQWAKQRGDTLDRRLKQEAGKHRALKKRINAGVCPCCHRTVRQLAAHMRDKHPTYTTETERTAHP